MKIKPGIAELIVALLAIPLMGIASLATSAKGSPIENV